MKLIISPIYSDIFKETQPELAEILSDISSNTILSILAYFDAQLYTEDTLEVQWRLLDKLIKRQTVETQKKIIENYTKYNNKGSGREISFISRLLIKAFMHYELSHFRELPITELTPQQELSIFKAYLIFASKENKKGSDLFHQESNKVNCFSFPEYTWPLLIGQLDSNYLINPIPYLIRGIALLNYLRYHSEYTVYVEAFLKKNGQTSSQDYIFSLNSILQTSWVKKNNGEAHHIISSPKEMEDIFINLSIDTNTYAEKYKNESNSLTGIKEKPLLKVKNNFVILDKNYLSNKIYEGLVYDFYNNSGINKCPRFKKFPDFKNFIGYEVTENYIFKPLLQYILKKKYCFLEFNKPNIKAFPDAYFRDGNTIVLFEIKDAYFPANAITTKTYASIKGSIDKKYNSEEKGIIQIVKQINQLQHVPFEDRSLSGNYPKCRNMKIYPVILYTDKYFSMPGVSNYLINEFNERIIQTGTNQNFKKINNLTFIDLNFVILYSNQIREIGYVKVIEKIHLSLEARKQKYLKEPNTHNVFKYSECLETIFKNVFMNSPAEEIKLEKITEFMNLAEGLS